jgi:hypothetical protein
MKKIQKMVALALAPVDDNVNLTEEVMSHYINF